MNKLAAAMKGDHLGEFEELTLLTVLGLGDQAYGVSVQEALERDTKRRVAIGAVYSALTRLEAKGLLVSRLGPATAERGGRGKRMFEVTATGRQVLRTIRRTRERLWRTIEAEQKGRI